MLQTHSTLLPVTMTHYVRNLVELFALLQIAPSAMHNPLIRMRRYCNAIRKHHARRHANAFASVRAAVWQRRISPDQIRSDQLADGGVVYGQQIRLKARGDYMFKEITVNLVEWFTASVELPHCDSGRVQIIGLGQGRVQHEPTEGGDVLRRTTKQASIPALKSSTTKVTEEEAKRGFVDYEIAWFDIAVNDSFPVKAGN